MTHTHTGNDLCQNVRTGFTHPRGPSCSERASSQTQLLTKGGNRVIAGGSCYALFNHVYWITRLFQERHLIIQMSLCSYFCFLDTQYVVKWKWLKWNMIEEGTGMEAKLVSYILKPSFSFDFHVGGKIF